MLLPKSRIFANKIQELEAMKTSWMFLVLAGFVMRFSGRIVIKKGKIINMHLKSNRVYSVDA